MGAIGAMGLASSKRDEDGCERVMEHMGRMECGGTAGKLTQTLKTRSNFWLKDGWDDLAWRLYLVD